MTLDFYKNTPKNQKRIMIIFQNLPKWVLNAYCPLMLLTVWLVEF